jgi:PilZ domain
MENPIAIANSSPPLERRHRRFLLQYPVRLKVQSADLMVEFEATSRNISIGGLLLETSSMIPQHTAVSFVVTAEGSELSRPIQFVGEGKVVRVDPTAAEDAFAIAVECRRPITQIDHHSEATGN